MPLRLLLAEDDTNLSVRLRSELARAGFAVDIAANGVDAGHLGAHEPYDAVILDLGLPGRSGIEVLKQWRADGNKVPVLVLTVRDAWQEKVDGFRAGADDYLGKPFHTEELIARLHSLIRRSHALPPGPLCVDGVTLDEDRQAALFGGRTVALTGVEFRLLRYLMLHAGKVVPKSELLDHVYDYDSEKESNVIEVHVGHLRSKLDGELIRTRRGQGYVFGRPDR